MKATKTKLNGNSSILTKEDMGFDIKVTWLAIAKMYSPLATQYGLTVTMGFTLLNISTEKGTQATKIAPLLGMEPRSLTRMIKKMEEEGLIERRPDLEDKRSVRIFLTDEGMKKKHEAKEVVESFNRAVRKDISNKDLKVFFEVLEKVHQIIQQHKVIES